MFCLRCSLTHSQQRSTYRLQLPYHYILPLMATMAVLHWVISRSIFVIEMEIVDLEVNPTPSLIACGYSGASILVAIILGTALILVLSSLALRGLEPGIPLAGSCSLAISSACQAGEKIAQLEPLKYGEVFGRRGVSDASVYAGFSRCDVSPLENGRLYGAVREQFE